jgi:hypothetical protein
MALAVASVALGRAEAQDTSRVLDLVNQHRAAAGLSPLIRAAELDSAARRHSDDMATNNFGARSGSTGGTTSPTTSTPRITGRSPTHGPSGTTVTIDGQYFGATQGSSRVYFRRTDAYLYGSVTVLSWSDGRVTARLSTSQKGTYYVWVRRGDGKNTNAVTFTVE